MKRDQSGGESLSQKIWTSEDLKNIGFQTEDEVHQITNAETRQSVDVDSRFKSYAFRMALRVVCIIAALFTHGWVQIALIVGAAIIPWVAVVAANGANRQPRADFSQFLPEHQVRMLEAARRPDVDQEKDDSGVKVEHFEVIEGELVEDED